MLLRPFAFLFALVAGQTAAASENPPSAAIITNQIEGHQVAFSHSDDEGTVTAYDVVAAYNDHMTAPADCTEHHARFAGITWCFSTDENRETFVAAIDGDDNMFVPAFGGRCTLGLSYGSLTARGDPRTAIRIGDALVLNGSFDARTSFLKDTERHMDNARTNMQFGERLGDIVPNGELTAAQAE